MSSESRYPRTEQMSEAEKDDLLERLADEVEDEDPVLSRAFELASQVSLSEGSN